MIHSNLCRWQTQRWPEEVELSVLSVGPLSFSGQQTAALRESPRGSPGDGWHFQTCYLPKLPFHFKFRGRSFNICQTVLQEYAGVLLPGPCPGLSWSERHQNKTRSERGHSCFIVHCIFIRVRRLDFSWCGVSGRHLWFLIYMNLSLVEASVDESVCTFKSFDLEVNMNKTRQQMSS